MATIYSPECVFPIYYINNVNEILRLIKIKSFEKCLFWIENFLRKVLFDGKKYVPLHPLKRRGSLKAQQESVL